MTRAECLPGIVVRGSGREGHVIGIAPCGRRAIIKETSGRVGSLSLSRLTRVTCPFCIDPDCWNRVFLCDQAKAVIPEAVA